MFLSVWVALDLDLSTCVDSSGDEQQGGTFKSLIRCLHEEICSCNSNIFHWSGFVGLIQRACRKWTEDHTWGSSIRTPSCGSLCSPAERQRWTERGRSTASCCRVYGFWRLWNIFLFSLIDSFMFQFENWFQSMPTCHQHFVNRFAIFFSNQFHCYKTNLIS